MRDFMEIVKSLEDAGLLLKGVSETIENEAKEQKSGFLSMLLATLGASLLGNILARKGIIELEKKLQELVVETKKVKTQQQNDKIIKNGIFNAASSFN